MLIKNLFGFTCKRTSCEKCRFNKYKSEGKCEKEFVKTIKEEVTKWELELK